jgi:hypothetical protein
MVGRLQQRLEEEIRLDHRVAAKVIVHVTFVLCCIALLCYVCEHVSYARLLGTFVS